MNRFPGMALGFVLLVFLLCLGLVEKWNPFVIGAIGAALGSLLSYLLVQGLLGGIRYYRLRRRESGRDHNSTIRRLVQSLASRDREAARRAARILGEITSQPAGPGHHSAFPPEETSSGRRWNDWWLANHSTLNFKNDKS
ncbi:MAG: hypothetical protein HYU36_17015 [Planctomycetes bacterium]|nr:hypothetical protein [Planctomycetota bacterium]